MGPPVHRFINTPPPVPDNASCLRSQQSQQKNPYVTGFSPQNLEPSCYRRTSVCQATRCRANSVDVMPLGKSSVKTEFRSIETEIKEFGGKNETDFFFYSSQTSHHASLPLPEPPPTLREHKSCVQQLKGSCDTNHRVLMRNI